MGVNSDGLHEGEVRLRAGVFGVHMPLEIPLRREGREEGVGLDGTPPQVMSSMDEEFASRGASVVEEIKAARERFDGEDVPGLLLLAAPVERRNSRFRLAAALWDADLEGVDGGCMDADASWGAEAKVYGRAVPKD